MAIRIRFAGYVTRLTLLSLSTAALLLAAACGGSSPTATPQPTATPSGGTATATPAGGGEATPTPTSGAAATATPAAAEPTTAPTDDRYGGVLNLAYFRDPTPPDGYQARGGFEGFFIWTNNEAVLGRGQGSTIAQEESLAESWEVLDEGLRVRLNLRQGVQFQDGKGEMTAEDVAWSFSRWYMPDEAGCGDCATLYRAVERVEQVDTYTVDLHLERVEANIVGRLSERGSIIHSKAHWEAIGGEDPHKSNPIGTGPYLLTEWRPGTNIKYVRHDDWWRGRPYADEVNVLTITETRTRLAALETGQVNIAFLVSEMIPAARNNPNIDVWSGFFGRESWSANSVLPPIDDIRVRRALVKAVDREALNTAVYLDTMTMSTTSCGFPNPPDASDCTDLWQTDWFSYDPAGAKALVEEYASERGLTLPLQLRGAVERRPDRQQLHEFLQGSWRDIGIEYTWENTANVAASGDITAQCESAAMHSTGGSIVDLEQLERQYSLLNSDRHNTCLEKGKTLNPEDQAIQDEIEALLVQASTTIDDQARFDLYKQVDYLGTKYVFAVFPLMTRENFFGCDNRITGGCGNELTGENPNRGEGFYRTGDFWVKR